MAGVVVTTPDGRHTGLLSGATGCCGLLGGTLCSDWGGVNIGVLLVAGVVVTTPDGRHTGLLDGETGSGGGDVSLKGEGGGERLSSAMPCGQGK